MASGKKIEFEWNDAGFQEILNSDGVAKITKEAADQIAELATQYSEDCERHGKVTFEAVEWHPKAKGGRAGAKVRMTTPDIDNPFELAGHIANHVDLENLAKAVRACKS